MGSTFEQRRFFEKRKYEIRDDGIQIYSSSLNRSANTFLKFEQIGFFRTVVSKGNNFWLFGVAFSIFGMAMVVFSIVSNAKDASSWYDCFFYVILLVVCIGGYMVTYKKRIIFNDYEKEDGIDFLTLPESDLKLKDFLKELKLRRDNYLLAVYGQIDKNLPYQSLHNRLLWLKNNEVITEQEWNAKCEELERTFNSNKKIIGFGPKN